MIDNLEMPCKIAHVLVLRRSEWLTLVDHGYVTVSQDYVWSGCTFGTSQVVPPCKMVKIFTYCVITEEVSNSSSPILYYALNASEP